LGGGGGGTLTVTLVHFPELEPEMELLGSGCNADLTEGQLDALWDQMRHASESLALNIPLSIARDSLMTVTSTIGESILD
jgi:hypothetical protein